MLNFKLSGNSFAPRAGKIYEKTNIINVSDPERLLSFATGLALYAIAFTTKKGKFNRLFSYGGLYFVYRGISGNCPVRASLQKSKTQQHTHAVNIRSSFIVNASRPDVYKAWRNIEQLPRFFKHIKKIKIIDDIHSHWVLKTPRSVPAVEWDAEIIDQQNNHELSWRSTSGSVVENAGKIIFADTLNGTEVIVIISYRPPAGYLGSAVAHYINPGLKKMVEEDLLRFKKYIESKAGN